MGGAPRNPAPRNHFLVWIVKPSGWHCTDGHLTSRVFTEESKISYRVPTPLRSTSPFSESSIYIYIYILDNFLQVFVYNIFCIYVLFIRYFYRSCAKAHVTPRAQRPCAKNLQGRRCCAAAP